MTLSSSGRHRGHVPFPGCDGRPRIEHLRPLARLGGNEWSTIGEILEIPRIPYRRWAEDPSIGERVRGE